MVYTSHEMTAPTNLSLENVLRNPLSTFWCRLNVVVVDKMLCIHNCGKVHSYSAVTFLSKYGNILFPGGFQREDVPVCGVSLKLS